MSESNAPKAVKKSTTIKTDKPVAKKTAAPEIAPPLVPTPTIPTQPGKPKLTEHASQRRVDNPDEIRTKEIKSLLAELRDTQNQADKKRIRGLLRRRGYRISDAATHAGIA